MATIRITKHEIRNKLLPQVCVFTGEPTGHTIRRRFRKTPPWVPVAFVCSPIIRIFFLVLFSHADMAPPAFIYLFSALPLLLGILGLLARQSVVIYVPVSPRKARQWVWPSVFGLPSSLYAKEITVTDIALAGVHPNFVAVVREVWLRETIRLQRLHEDSAPVTIQ